MKAEPFFSKKIAISRRIEIFRGVHYTEFLNWLNTCALPGFLRAGVSKKRSRTAGPLPVYRSTGRAQLAKRKVGPWLCTALPISPMLRQLAKRKVGPWLRTALPGSPMLRQLAWEPPQKSQFSEIFLQSSCTPRGNRIFFKKNKPFHNPISSFIKTIPTSVGTSSLCIILHNNTKEYCNMEHKFSKIRSSLIAHRSSLIAHRKN